MTIRRSPAERALLSAAVLALSGSIFIPDSAAAAPLAFGACRVVAEDHSAAVARVSKISARVIESNFPKLVGRSIEFRSFESNSTFFKTRFSVSRYLTFRGTRILLSVNPCVFKLEAPPDGVEAIIAHELAHAENYFERNAFERLGLIRLLDGDSLARFERRTDLVAIERGYAPGLIKYRYWLYENVTSKQVEKKRRNYFSPEEIAALDAIMRSDPERFRGFYRGVPLGICDLFPAGKAQRSKE
ncbi:MAG: hypothetical protein KF762_08760 [Acidobacteria bacterium]|nr:hypothetical protein [Acidobacteriota bacterium]